MESAGRSSAEERPLLLLDDDGRSDRRRKHRTGSALDSPFLRRFRVARWILSLLLLPVFLLALGAAPATGLLTLPYAILFGSLTWWLLLGAPKHSSTPWLWTFYVGVGLIAAEFLAALVAFVVSR